METYCVSCKKNTAHKSSRIRKTWQNRFIAFSKLCCLLQEKTRFIENQKLH